jgi:predicted alpha-1,6-mannanase (GH76 family)
LTSLTRRSLLVRAAGLTAAAAIVPYLDSHGSWMPSTAFAADNASRAADAYKAMQTTFYQSSTRLYREHSDTAGDQPISYLWSFEEATKATLAMYGIPNAANTYASAIQDRLSARETYWDGGTTQRGYRSYPSTGDRYYDDNCWVGSDLLQHHLMTSRAATSPALDRAKSVFSFIQTGWTTNLPKTGGVRWVDADFNGDRACDSTAGWVKLGAHLYDATGRKTKSYLDSAVNAYNWLKQYLLTPNGLYANSVRADGTLDPTQWIYNQGVVIGAAVLLYRVTGTAQYLSDASNLADATLAAFGGDPYYSGTMGAYAGRGIFNAIFFRNLLMLYAVNHNAVYLQKMQAYADAVFTNMQSGNLYRLNGETRYSLLDQASMVQVFAFLSWDAGTYAKLT